MISKELKSQLSILKETNQEEFNEQLTNGFQTFLP